jgi:hypothetical protein
MRIFSVLLILSLSKDEGRRVVWPGIVAALYQRPMSLTHRPLASATARPS